MKYYIWYQLKYYYKLKNKSNINKRKTTDQESSLYDQILGSWAFHSWTYVCLIFNRISPVINFRLECKLFEIENSNNKTHEFFVTIYYPPNFNKSNSKIYIYFFTKHVIGLKNQIQSLLSSPIQLFKQTLKIYRLQIILVTNFYFF